VPAEIRQLIREMSVANPLWGAPRIHGELVKLGIDIGQTSVTAGEIGMHRALRSVGKIGMDSLIGSYAPSLLS
jgi:hypothetical protein